MSQIGYALRVAKQYYDKETYEHALRVAGFVADNIAIPKEDMDNCIALAIMHDLLEDTEYKADKSMHYYLRESLKIVTRDPEMSYFDYIGNIVKCREGFPCVYYVKLADIKDHLLQKETLTDSMRDRYVSALAILL